DRYTFHYDEMRQENDGKQMKNVWRIPAAGRSEKRHGKHPTQKPLALIDRCLRAGTNPGDVVFDPFAGTGAVGVAALRLGRRFIGGEREAEYAHIAAARLSETAPQIGPPGGDSVQRSGSAQPVTGS
ncbi:MAG: site-specific DNA-methyltransferase, partial [Chloroflexi bacterium]|nr:site-specific DNA-methyltransferase [Chloroflexota bacterium]